MFCYVLLLPAAAAVYNIESEGARYMYRTVKDVRFPLSVRNEVAAMERLLVLTKGALAAYPTTLEEDEAALKVRWADCRCVRACVCTGGSLC